MSLKYKQILEYFNEDYNEFVECNNMSYREALARTFGEYETVANVGEMQKGAVYLAYGELVLSLDKILDSAKINLISTLENLNLNIISEKLDDTEFEDFVARKKFILSNISKINVTNYGRVCWEYSEIIDQVNKHIDNISKKTLSIDELIELSLKRFECDCKNTESEKITIYVVILEKILSLNEINKSNLIFNLFKVIHEFDILNIKDEQFTKEEQELLLSKIEILKTIKL